MAVELVIRTSKVEYSSEDTIFGAVYLKVSSPTSAYGILVKFYGCETFTYQSDKDKTITDRKEYISSGHDKLYEFEEPISLGQYVFPFQKRLPLALPGSSWMRHCEAGVPEWKFEIAYKIEACVLGAESVKASQMFIIIQPSLTSIIAAPPPLDCTAKQETRCSHAATPARQAVVTNVRGLLPFTTKQVTVTASLDRCSYHVGDNISVRLEMSSTGNWKPKVDSIKFQLVRDIRISFSETEITTGSVGASKRSGSWLMSLLAGNGGPLNTIPLGYVHPEGNAIVVWSSQLIDLDGTRLTNGFEGILVPLRDFRCTDDLPATTVGSHILLIYSLKIEINLQRNEPISLSLPVDCVWPQSKEWSNWQPADWLFNSKILASAKSLFYVSQAVLESVEFSSLPTFQTV